MKKGMRKGFLLFLPVIVMVLAAGCGGDRSPQGPAVKAVAVLQPTDGSKVKGYVSFLKDRKGVRIVGEVEGLTPGLHGFHVHEYGDCGSPDAASAGGHFNPTGKPHGAPNSDKRHVGDLGNIDAPKTGPARFEIVDKQIALDGPNSIIGRAVVVHAEKDDFKTQPTGGAGARVACGVVGIAKE